MKIGILKAKFKVGYCGKTHVNYDLITKFLINKIAAKLMGEATAT